MNSVTVIGRLTNDPEQRYTSQGTAITKFNLAINEKYKDKETTVFVGVVLWGKTAEIAAEYLAKGNQVGLAGRLSFSSWETDKGEKRSKLEVTAERITFIGSGKSKNDSTDVPF